jgi:hypothetical protein
VVNRLPASCGIAFKEWASVCDALLAGRQTIILRKGGISEGTAPGHFVPEHSEFWLYPTWVHQAEQGVRERVPGSDATCSVPGDGQLQISALVRVELVGYVRSDQSLSLLEEHHILTRETVLNRFHYRQPGLWVLAARVWRKEPCHEIAPTPEHAGCKTWVKLVEALSTGGVAPVLDDVTWTERLDRIRAALASTEIQSTGPLVR